MVQSINKNKILESSEETTSTIQEPPHVKGRKFSVGQN